MLVASNFGQTHHPGWYYNLRACPEAQVTYQGKTVAYTVREASEVEAEVYWKQAGEIYRGYPLYRQRAKERVISIFVLTRLH